MDNLRALLASDLSQADLDTLFKGVKDSDLTRSAASAWAGRFVAELRRREVPWSVIEKATGKDKTTLDRWAGQLELE